MRKKKVKSPVKGEKIARVPVSIQIDELESGPLCLKMVLDFYKKYISPSELKEACNVSRNGCTAQDIFKVAESYDLKATAYRWNVDELKEHCTFPAIIYWDATHFAVLKGIKKNKFYINDPDFGEKIIEEKYFKDHYSFITLVFVPNENFLPSGKRETSLSFIKKVAAQKKAVVIFGGVGTLISMILGICMPLISKDFFDKILPNNGEGLGKFLGIYSGIYIALILLSLLSGFALPGVTKKTVDLFALGYLKELFHSPIEFYYQRKRGDLMVRQDKTVEISKTAINTIGPLIVNFIATIGFLIILFIYSWPLAIICLVSLITISVLAYFVSIKKLDLTKRSTRNVAKYESNTITFFDDTTLIATNSYENQSADSLNSDLFASIYSKNELEKKSIILNSVPQILNYIFSAFLLSVGIIFIIKGVKVQGSKEFTIGLITAFTGIYDAFCKPSINFITSSQKLMELYTHVERTDDVLNFPKDIKIYDTEGKYLEKLKGEIEIKNLNFAYSSLSDDTVKDINFKIKPGQKIAIIGENSSGKTALLKIFGGLYTHYRGELLFDGHPMVDFEKSFFAKNVSLILQDVRLFEDTIRNNITLWDNAISDEDIKKVLSMVNLNHFIDKLDTKLIKKAHNISNSEKIKLDIARSLINNPSIIIFDDVLDQLDALDKIQIFESIHNFNKTLIFSTDELLLASKADYVIYLDKGKIVQSGKPNDVLSDEKVKNLLKD